jgi:hypothetical protein
MNLIMPELYSLASKAFLLRMIFTFLWYFDGCN